MKPKHELPDTVTHPSTNRARRRVTSLMYATPLPLSQSANLEETMAKLKRRLKY